MGEAYGRAGGNILPDASSRRRQASISSGDFILFFVGPDDSLFVAYFEELTRAFYGGASFTGLAGREWNEEQRAKVFWGENGGLLLQDFRKLFGN